MIVVDEWLERSNVVYENLGKLSDFGNDYWKFLNNSCAVGTHVTVMAICGVFSVELT
eukprot:CAMPEP_0119336198 /NCGR_PEP_ID=MMETSP1333-20130426/91323_1 /TAXON_ID=418940 /ORGANISM="Scyphosphaera apsteinii, Strain RCC1455" /LENGTH=56 /DNA_ID=CAMNT_0007346953 /DNA_START=114 /DNA_END=284 /DNA_ORIENTATION=+